MAALHHWTCLSTGEGLSHLGGPGGVGNLHVGITHWDPLLAKMEVWDHLCYNEWGAPVVPRRLSYSARQI